MLTFLCFVEQARLLSVQVAVVAALLAELVTMLVAEARAVEEVGARAEAVRAEVVVTDGAADGAVEVGKEAEAAAVARAAVAEAVAARVGMRIEVPVEREVRAAVGAAGNKWIASTCMINSYIRNM